MYQPQEKTADQKNQIGRVEEKFSHFHRINLNLNALKLHIMHVFKSCLLVDLKLTKSILTYDFNRLHSHCLMKRQTFLRTVTGTTIGLTTAVGGWFTLQGIIRIRPVSPDTCGRSFLAFCKRARFATAEEAVQITARRGQPFELYLADDENLPLPPALPLQPAVAPEQIGLARPIPALTPPDNSRALKALKTAQIHSRGDQTPAATSMNIGPDSVG